MTTRPDLVIAADTPTAVPQTPVGAASAAITVPGPFAARPPGGPGTASP